MWHNSTTFHPGVTQQGLGLADAWRLWDYKSHSRSAAYLTGASAVFPLVQVWQARMALMGIKTHTIDCAIRFNTYAIAEEALRLGHPPELIHDQITVTRAFTPYQILDAVAELKKNEVVFVLAPAKQFFDGDVAFDEGLFLLQKLVRFFADAHCRGVALFVVERPSYAAPAFSTFLSDIRALTERSRWELYRLGAEHSYRLKYLTNGILAREISSLPQPKPIEAAKIRFIPRAQPSQMTFNY
jgi:hypothetical protein